ncbi:Modulator of drug activity B [Liberibacter crescens BT-1]|uniref:Modulator of drug activity B n=1 Tax=Liberibacter crescens (strain BT-1) TaxID=1215343 RepID=L0EW35_LIBCB|nr:NAD(P)H-dependent oxidoreductase [Liberibacter crescens]AGA64581.1 Modulator of drug activity B [Liberibacter crescens BT-1]AMC12715.1 flavodoxin [Liberibacter crescens]
MNKVFILNAHQYYGFSSGKLNAAIIHHIDEHFKRKGFEILHTHVMDKYDVKEELDKHLWADVIILQTPVYWMGVPWLAKKYMDEVYTAGVDGILCKHDGRSSKAPKDNYGGGGCAIGKKYMLSLTFNAPKEAFDDPSQYLFQGKSVDDLFYPYHMNFRFFAMEPLPTFSCYDVVKNPEIENDFKRLEEHLNTVFKK